METCRMQMENYAIQMKTYRIQMEKCTIQMEKSNIAMFGKPYVCCPYTQAIRVNDQPGIDFTSVLSLRCKR
jgi:hypothetical protein